MTGSGNDFVLVDAACASPDDWDASDIRRCCARGTGIGADGLVFVAPGSRPGAIRMIYFNSDGSRAALCGNAALCTTRLARTYRLSGTAGRSPRDRCGNLRDQDRGEDGRAELHLAPVAVPEWGPAAVQAGEERAALCIGGGSASGRAGRERG